MFSNDTNSETHNSFINYGYYNLIPELNNVGCHILHEYVIHVIRVISQ